MWEMERVRRTLESIPSAREALKQLEPHPAPPPLSSIPSAREALKHTGR